MGKYEFEEVSLPKWKVTFLETADKVYRVFKSADEFEEVEATSANEAVQKAGIEDVYEIRVGSMDAVSVFDQSHLTEVPQDISEEIPIEAATEANPEATPA